MESYTISGEDTEIRVIGSIKNNGQVTVVKDGEEYVYNSNKGHLDEGAVSAKLVCPDGSVIDEGAVSQDIKLPDGTQIHKGAVTRKATLPDGRTIKEDEEDENSINIQTSSGVFKIEIQSSTDASTNVRQSVEQTGNRTKVTQKTTVNEENSDDGVDWVEKFVPGFWTTLIFAYGVVFFEVTAILIAIMLYLTYTIPALFRLVGRKYMDSSDGDSEKEEQTDRLEEIKTRYAEGSLSDEEFEEKLENYFQDQEDIDGFEGVEKIDDEKEMERSLA